MAYFFPARKYYRGQLVEEPAEVIEMAYPWQQVTLQSLPLDSQVPAWSSALGQYIPVTIPTGGGGGTGDVVGPAGSVNDEIALMDGVTGKLIKGSGVLIANLRPIQVTGLTLTTAGWSLVGGLYQQDLANANITAASIVDVIPDNADVNTVTAALFLPRTDSSSGSVRVYAQNLPSANIGVTINILNT